MTAETSPAARRWRRLEWGLGLAFLAAWPLATWITASSLKGELVSIGDTAGLVGLGLLMACVIAWPIVSTAGALVVGLHLAGRRWPWLRIAAIVLLGCSLLVLGVLSGMIITSPGARRWGPG